MNDKREIFLAVKSVVIKKGSFIDKNCYFTKNINFHKMIKITFSIESPEGGKVSVEKEYSGTTENYCIDEIESLVERAKNDLLPLAELALLEKSQKILSFKKKRRT